MKAYQEAMLSDGDVQHNSKQMTQQSNAGTWTVTLTVHGNDCYLVYLAKKLNPRPSCMENTEELQSSTISVIGKTKCSKQLCFT